MAIEPIVVEGAVPQPAPEVFEEIMPVEVPLGRLCIIDIAAPGGVRSLRAVEVELADTFVYLQEERVPLREAVRAAHTADRIDQFQADRRVGVAAGDAVWVFEWRGEQVSVPVDDIFYLGLLESSRVPVFIPAGSATGLRNDWVTALGTTNYEMEAVLRRDRRLRNRAAALQALYLPLRTHGCSFAVLTRGAVLVSDRPPPPPQPLPSDPTAAARSWASALVRQIADLRPSWEPDSLNVEYRDSTSLRVRLALPPFPRFVAPTPGDSTPEELGFVLTVTAQLKNKAGALLGSYSQTAVSGQRLIWDWRVPGASPGIDTLYVELLTEASLQGWTSDPQRRTVARVPLDVRYGPWHRFLDFLGADGREEARKKIVWGILAIVTAVVGAIVAIVVFGVEGVRDRILGWLRRLRANG